MWMPFEPRRTEMTQRLIITLRKNIIPKDTLFDCIYDERSDVGDLIRDWLRYNPLTDSYKWPLYVAVRDWDIFDQFMGDFIRIKDTCSSVACFEDVWRIFNEKEKKVIHVSAIQDALLKDASTDIIDDLYRWDDS
jgi:hypothetical protein